MGYMERPKAVCRTANNGSFDRHGKILEHYEKVELKGLKPANNYIRWVRKHGAIRKLIEVLKAILSKGG